MPTASALSAFLEGGLQRSQECERECGDGRPFLEGSAAQDDAGRGADVGQNESGPIGASRRYAAGLAEMHRGFVAAERRHITPVNGHALEILGHAIEYLADEYALSSLQLGTLDSGDPRVEAVQILILLNREIYFSNPEYEPLRRRLARWLFRAPTLAPAERAYLDPQA